VKKKKDKKQKTNKNQNNMKTSSLILWGVAAFAGYKLYKNYQANKLAEAQKKAMDEAAEEFEENSVVDSQYSNVVMAEYGRLRPTAWQISQGKKYRFSNAVNNACAGSAGGSCYTWIRINGVPRQVIGTLGSDCRCNPIQKGISHGSTTGSIV